MIKLFIYSLLAIVVALVAANALVLEGKEFPPRTLVAGVPAKPRRELTDEEVDRFWRGIEVYVQRRAIYLKEQQGI